MSTPADAPMLPVGRPDPSTPGARPKPTALSAATTTAVAGTPTALLSVWLLETYGTAHGQPLHLDSLTATVIGSVGGAVMGYLAQVGQALIGVLTDKLLTLKG